MKNKQQFEYMLGMFSDFLKMRDKSDAGLYYIEECRGVEGDREIEVEVCVWYSGVLIWKRSCTYRDLLSMHRNVEDMYKMLIYDIFCYGINASYIDTKKRNGLT